MMGGGMHRLQSKHYFDASEAPTRLMSSGWIPTGSFPPSKIATKQHASHSLPNTPMIQSVSGR